MSPSYQTIPPANAPKDDPSSTLVPMMKKIGIVAMVGTALVVGYSYYGSSTNPARIDIATTTMTTTTAAANLVRGGVSNNGDAGQEDFSSTRTADTAADIEKNRRCYDGPCNKDIYRNERACRNRCTWQLNDWERDDYWDLPGNQGGRTENKAQTERNKNRIKKSADTIADIEKNGCYDGPCNQDIYCNERACKDRCPWNLHDWERVDYWDLAGNQGGRTENKAQTERNKNRIKNFKCAR